VDDRAIWVAAQDRAGSPRYLHASHRVANQQAPARLIQEQRLDPVLMPSIRFRRLISGSLPVAFVIHTRHAQGAPFPQAQHPGSRRRTSQ
jgi:hypothetical protein